MRLGATIGDYLGTEDPDAHVAECRRQGYRAAPCPEVAVGDRDRIRDIKRAFGEADIVIGEVAAWVNPLHPDADKRRANRNTIAERLALADELEAVCCATVVGSYDGSDNWDSHVGHHPQNFSEEGFEAVVEWVRQVLTEVEPRRTKLTLEMSPWTLLDGPEIYLALLEAIDHPGLGVHLDPANAVREPRIYYATTELLNRCFDILGPWVRSCHAKDIHFALDARTVAIEEVLPGRGVLDYRTYVSRIERLSPDMPLIIEHLATEPEYKEVGDFIRGVANEVGATI